METRDHLEQLLKCDMDFPSYDYYIWGTGNTSDLYQEGLKRLEAEGIEIKGYFDNDPAKWGREYYGKPVFSPKDAEKLKNVLIIALIMNCINMNIMINVIQIVLMDY